MCVMCLATKVQTGGHVALSISATSSRTKTTRSTYQDNMIWFTCALRKAMSSSSVISSGTPSKPSCMYCDLSAHTSPPLLTLRSREGGGVNERFAYLGCQIVENVRRLREEPFPIRELYDGRRKMWRVPRFLDIAEIRERPLRVLKRYQHGCTRMRSLEIGLALYATPAYAKANRTNSPRPGIPPQ